MKIGWYIPGLYCCWWCDRVAPDTVHCGRPMSAPEAKRRADFGNEACPWQVYWIMPAGIQMNRSTQPVLV